jgi:hypothetical protein
MTKTIANGVILFSVLLQGLSALDAHAQERAIGSINWIEGYVRAIGKGTTNPSPNRVKDEMRALRVATLMAQRSLLEIVKGVKIDSQTTVDNMMLQEDAINARVEGTIRGAEIVRQDVRWEGDRPIATVELRICLSGLGACKSEKSLISALNLDQKNEQSDAPRQRLNDIKSSQGNIAQRNQDVIYDSSRPVTGIILNLQGLYFERVILPVVITAEDENKPITVYSIKNVEPQVIRTYGVVRYTDSVEQAKQNPHLGSNPIIVPVSAITKENMIMIGFDAARVIRETTLYGNDYLKSAKVIIAAK